MERQSLKIALSFNDNNIEALNNMGIFDMKEGFGEKAKN